MHPSAVVPEDGYDDNDDIQQAKASPEEMQALKMELELGIHGDADDLPLVFFVLLSAYALGDFGSSWSGYGLPLKSVTSCCVHSG